MSSLMSALPSLLCHMLKNGTLTKSILPYAVFNSDPVKSIIAALSFLNWHSASCGCLAAQFPFDNCFFHTIPISFSVCVLHNIPLTTRLVHGSV